MQLRNKIIGISTLGALLAVATFTSPATAADHTDSPDAADDPAADIADLYVWHTADDRLVTALTFAGLGDAGVAATYDADVVYGIHIDRDDDGVSDHDIWVRFGQNGAGEWGVQAADIPGESAPVMGAVEGNIDGDAGSKVFAGLREDPFFFDFQGFGETLETGTLSFDGDRDSFAGTNVTSIVLEMDLADAADGSNSLSIWATTSRKN